MKRVMKFLFLLMFSLVFISCSSGSSFIESFVGEKLFGFTAEEKFRNKLKSYKLEATIKTTKGDLNVFLYPEASPKLVANFVFLAKNDYYDNVTFHRVEVNNIIQSGDRTGTGKGYPGYFLNDEFSYLKFDRAGILAMANAGPNTNGSQFFITLQKEEGFNNYYSILGNLKSSEDLSIARLIRQEDKILDVEISGYNVDEFLDNFKDDVEKWQEELVK